MKGGNKLRVSRACAVFLFALQYHSASCSVNETAPETVELSKNTTIELEKVRYRLTKPSSLMGDGYAALVASISPKALQDYISRHATEVNGWRKGSVSEYDVQLVDFLTRWAKVKKVYEALHESGNVWEHIDSGDAIFWSHKDIDASGHITNGLLFIIIPSDNLLIMLREDT